MPDEALETLVGELLLERSEKLDGARLAAYLDGWSALLDLLRRTQLILPRAEPELHDALAEVVERIRAAMAGALDDGSG
jgi:hypothetical protein